MFSRETIYETFSCFKGQNKGVSYYVESTETEYNLLFYVHTLWAWVDFHWRTGMNFTGFTIANKIRDDVGTACVNVKELRAFQLFTFT